MIHPLPHPPSVAAYVDKALPVNGRINTLVLGESHLETAHWDWLLAHVDHLVDELDVKTFGLELPDYMNLFIWAYEDGTLARELGSPKKARDYLGMMFKHVAKPEYQPNAERTAELCRRMIDKGVRITSYDTRNALAERLKNVHTWEEKIPARLHAGYAEITKAVSEILRAEPGDAEHLMQECSADHLVIDSAWVVAETNWLQSLNPAYASRLDAMEKLIAHGHRLIEDGTLTSDGLSATMFDALAAPNGNRMVTGGAHHVNGIAWLYHSLEDEQPIERVHGTLRHHLFSIGQEKRPHQVTGSVVAAIATCGDERWLREHYGADGVSPEAVPNSHVALLDTRIDAVLPSRLPAHPFQPKKSDPSEYVGKNYPNPRAIDGIGILADRLSALMNGPNQSLQLT